jgi:hypothetical protein
MSCAQLGKAMAAAKNVAFMIWDFDIALSCIRHVLARSVDTVVEAPYIAMWSMKIGQFPVF